MDKKGDDEAQNNEEDYIKIRRKADEAIEKARLESPEREGNMFDDGTNKSGGKKNMAPKAKQVPLSKQKQMQNVKPSKPDAPFVAAPDPLFSG